MKDILDAFPHLSPDDCISTSMGAQGEDVRLSTAARAVVPLSIEAKCVEKLNIWGCIEQCESNTPEHATPCVVFSRNRSNAYAVIPWTELLALLQRLQVGGGGEEGGNRVPPRIASLVRELHACCVEKGSQ